MAQATPNHDKARVSLRVKAEYALRSRHKRDRKKIKVDTREMRITEALRTNKAEPASV